MTRREWTWLAALLGVAMVLRLAQLLEVVDTPFFLNRIPDSIHYDDWARRIVAGDWLSRFEPVFVLGPLYPYFLAFLYAPFGPSTLAVVLVQIALSTASVGMVVVLGRRLFEPWVGWIAGLLAATYAMYVFHASVVLAETLVVFLNLAALCALVEGVERRSWRWLLLAGLCVGLSAHARGNVLLFAPFAALAIVLAGRAREPRTWLPGLCAFAGAVALAVAPSFAHNAWIGGDRVLLTSNGGANLYIGNNADAEGIYLNAPRYKGRPLGIRLSDQQQNFAEVARAELGRATLAPSEVSAFWTRETGRQIASDPARWLRVLGAKLRYVVNAYEVPSNCNLYFARRFSRVLELPLLSFGAVLPFAVVGMALGLRGFRRRLALYGYALSVVLALLAFFVTDRYRLALTPVMLVFAASAAVEIARALRARRFALPLCCALALVPLYALTYAPVDRFSFQSDYANLGLAYESMGDLPRAIEQYDAAIEIAPGFYQIWTQKGMALAALGRRDEAALAFRQALDLVRANGDVAEAARIRAALAEAGLPPQP